MNYERKKDVIKFQVFIQKEIVISMHNKYIYIFENHECSIYCEQSHQQPIANEIRYKYLPDKATELHAVEITFSGNCTSPDKEWKL